jgi:hypothetical protein
MQYEVLKVIFGDTKCSTLAYTCNLLLTEAATRQHNPVDGLSVHIGPKEQFRLAAATLLAACGLLEPVGGEHFVLTEAGLAAVERLAKSPAAMRQVG